MIEDVALRELRELIDAGGWRPLPGGPTMLVFIRPWPDDSVDTLAVTSGTEALAERTNSDGDPVWREVGTLPHVIAALRNLATPDAVEAPRSLIRKYSVDRNF